MAMEGGAGADDSHSDGGDGESEAPLLDVALDCDGRLDGAATGLDYRTRSWPAFLAAGDTAALTAEVL